VAAARAPPGADEIVVGWNPPDVPGVHPAHARNLVARASRGDVLLFLDDDIHAQGDLRSVDPGYLEWMLPIWRDGTGDPTTQGSLNLANGLAAFGSWMGTIGGFVGVRRELLERVGGWPVAGLEDVGLGRRLRALGARPRVCGVVATALRPMPSAADALRRAPDWLNFPRPHSIPTRVYRPVTTTPGMVYTPG